MHTTTVTRTTDTGAVERWTVHHNGDFSGDSWFVIPTNFLTDDNQPEPRVSEAGQRTYHLVKIPFEVLAELVGQWAIGEEISRLEGMAGNEYLQGRQP